MPRHVRSLLVALMFFLGLATPGIAQPDDLSAMNAEVGRLFQQGHYDEATSLAQRALVQAERLRGRDQIELMSAVSNLGVLYHASGRYGDAEPLLKRALAIGEKLLGAGDETVGALANNLGELYRDEGRYVQAEPYYKRALAIWQKVSGPDHPDVATALNNLALLYTAEGRYADAEPLYKRAIAISEKASGPDDIEVGRTLNNLGELYRALGRYGEAEPLYRRSLAIREKALGPTNPAVATALNNLGLLDVARAHYADAEPLYQRALTIWENSLGPEHPYVATGLDNLAEAYRDEGRFAAAEPLMKRALAIREKTLGADHPHVATSLNNLAMLYHMQDRLAHAEPLYRRALAIREKALGASHSDVAASLNNLAELYRDANRLREAEPLYRRALAIWEKAVGPRSPDVASLLNNVALLEQAEGRSADARESFNRALKIRQEVLGPDHVEVGDVLNNLGWLAYEQGDWAGALDYWRQSTAVVIGRTRHGVEVLGQRPTGKAQSDAQRAGYRFAGLVKAAYHVSVDDPSRQAALARETFKAAQWAHASVAAATLAQMAARTATGDDALSQLVRERQDLVEQWQVDDAAMVAARSTMVSERDTKTEQALGMRLAKLDTRLSDVDKTLASKFPSYVSLANPEPLSIEETQDALRTDEALVLFIDAPASAGKPEEGFIWAVSKSDVGWARIDFGSVALAERVAALRCGLDVAAWRDQHCSKLLGISDTASDRELPFDLNRSYELYRTLLGPVADIIRGKHILFVPSGPLTTLPLQVLVTEKPRSTDYAAAAWIGMQQPITVLPAVASLQSLRKYARASAAVEPFIGFGNPLLDGNPSIDEDRTRAAMARDKQQCPNREDLRVASVLPAGRGGRVITVTSTTATALLRQLPPLPETADELCAVAQDFDVDPATHVYLGGRATETEIKQLSGAGKLAQYKIIHFATHGALAGELSATAEPGLILTPPTTANTLDDGYLSASEIAALKLDADWVILSACNTAGGEANGAEALSGLARAFFYAGARSLLVSHWEVASDSTVQLITKAVAELKSDPKIGRAEALRRAMLWLATTGKNNEAHPAFWAPFVLVGEGAASP